jgi:hypothetical protein
MTKPKMIIFVLAAVWLALLYLPAFSQNAYQISHTAQFSAEDLSFQKVEGYDVVWMKESGCLAQLARPMLPSVQIRIALPPGMEATGVRVVSTTSEEIPGEFDIFPSQPPLKLDLSDRNAGFVDPDPEIYGSTRPYPPLPAEFVRQTDLAGQGMAVVQLYPLCYIPASKRLTLYTSITISVEGGGGYECGDYLSPNLSETGRRTVLKMIDNSVVNSDDVLPLTGSSPKGSADLPDASFDHVIITSSSYATYFQPLADWHNQKGVRDTVITTTWIYANYTGADSQKVRQFVIDANSTWGTTYFLMGGENEVVPLGYRYYYQESAPGDQYYSDFDDDWTHEVYVGRVSVGNTTEINTFIDKLLKYEKDPPRTDYPSKALFVGMDLDGSTHAEYLKNTIDQNYLPWWFTLTTVYDSHTGNHKTAVIDALNDGQHLFNHADHGYIQYMGTGDYNHGLGISSADVDALTNDDEMSVVVSLACHPNHLDYNDCISEHFVLRNPYQAAVAFTGNTRSGWGYVGNPYSLSGALDFRWWEGLFDYDMYHLGQALVFTKHQFSTSTPDADLKRHCEWTFNLLGEPEMPVWTDDPDSFAVTCPSSLSKGKTLFEVHVEDSTTHLPVDSAYVCLLKEGEIYLTGYTDADGDVSFDPLPATAGSMYVTVTKHNYLPSQQQVEITFICGDFNVPGGDGVVDLSDALYLINYLFKSGPAPSPLEAADVNLDEVVEIGDGIYLLNYLYKGGSAPCNPE